MYLTSQHLLSLHHKLLVLRDVHAGFQSVERLAARAHLLASEVVDVAGAGRQEVDILDVCRAVAESQTELCGVVYVGMEESAVTCCRHGHIDEVELVAADVIVALVSRQLHYFVCSDERHTALGFIRRTVLAHGQVFERAHAEVLEHRGRSHISVGSNVLWKNQHIKNCLYCLYCL